MHVYFYVLVRSAKTVVKAYVMLPVTDLSNLSGAVSDPQLVVPSAVPGACGKDQAVHQTWFLPALGPGEVS